MTRKTISIDADVYRQLNRKKAPKESLSAALRRLLADEKDPADYLEELFSTPMEADLELLKCRQTNPQKSNRRQRAVL